MTDTELLDGALELLELTTAAELEHVIGCGSCYVFDSYDGGGPHYCREFRQQFRGEKPPPPPDPNGPASTVARLYGPMLRSFFRQLPPDFMAGPSGVCHVTASGIRVHVKPGCRCPRRRP